MDVNQPSTEEQPVSEHVWRFGDCEFDELSRELRVRGAAVELEAKPLEVLHQLLIHAGEVVTKDQLLESVWPGLMVVDSSVATAVSKLRKALGSDDTIVVTVPRVGYRLGVPARRTVPARTPSEPGRGLAAHDSGSPAAGIRRRVLFAGLAAATLAVLAAGVGLYRARPSPVAAPRGATARITSLAVLPLANISGDAAQDYFADGMTEALIADLSKIQALRVISRTTVMQYKGVRKPLPQIARELHVDGIVEGSVQRSGDRVRLTAQLIDASADAHLWSETYDRDLGDILNLQRELARQVSREIHITVQPSEVRQLVAAARVNPAAHELYLRGRFFWNRRTRDDLFKAAEYFQKAIDVDPSAPLAYAGLADAEVELVGFGNVQPADGVPRAKAAALKAIALNESLAEAHVALAYAHAEDWMWSDAYKEFQRALELNPGNVVALYQYGFFLSLTGNFPEAISLVQRAVESDPLSAIAWYRAGRVYYHARQYDKAAEQFRRILELNPDDQLGLYGLGLVYAAQGRFEEAMRNLRKESLQRGFDLAGVYAAAGQVQEARRRLAEALRRQQRQASYLRPGWVAEVYVSLGEKDEAFRWLERGFAERDTWLALLRVWPPFDPLRSDPRFKDLLKRLNFPG